MLGNYFSTAFCNFFFCLHFPLMVCARCTLQHCFSASFFHRRYPFHNLAIWLAWWLADMIFFMCIVVSVLIWLKQKIMDIAK